MGQVISVTLHVTGPPWLLGGKKFYLKNEICEPKMGRRGLRNLLWVGGGGQFFSNVYWKILPIVTKAVPKDLGCEDGRWVGVICSDELCDKPVCHNVSKCMFLIANGLFTGTSRLTLAHLQHHMCHSWAWLLAQFILLVFLNILSKVVCRIWHASAMLHLFVHIL